MTPPLKGVGLFCIRTAVKIGWGLDTKQMREIGKNVEITQRRRARDVKKYEEVYKHYHDSYFGLHMKPCKKSIIVLLMVAFVILIGVDGYMLTENNVLGTIIVAIFAAVAIVLLVLLLIKWVQPVDEKNKRKEMEGYMQLDHDRDKRNERLQYYIDCGELSLSTHDNSGSHGIIDDVLSYMLVPVFGTILALLIAPSTGISKNLILALVYLLIVVVAFLIGAKQVLYDTDDTVRCTKALLKDLYFLKYE